MSRHEARPIDDTPGVTPRRFVLIIVGFLVAAVAVVTTVVVLHREPEHVVDESAWRQARETQGTTFTDWRLYVDSFMDVCDDDDFGYFVALRLDDGETAEALRTDFTYACPSRLPDFERELQGIADPCAGMNAEDKALIEEAVGGGYQC